MTADFTMDPATGDVTQADEPTEIVVAGARMPATRSVLAEMREHLEGVVRQAREERGEVHLPEDVFPVVNRLAEVIDGLDDYAHAFKVIRKEAVDYIGDELETAVGEQDGVPNQGLKVPAPDGTTVDVSVDAPSSYSFDLDALINAVVADTLTLWTGASADGLDRLLEAAIRVVLALGSFTPQVTKVKAYKNEVARQDPKMASTITWAKTSNFRGIKVKREQPKKGTAR